MLHSPKESICFKYNDIMRLSRFNILVKPFAGLEGWEGDGGIFLAEPVGHMPQSDSLSHCELQK